MGADLAIVPFHIPTDVFDKVFPALLAIGNIVGFIVTYPFKEICLTFADRVSTGARLVGGLNAMRREEDGTWTADIFDGVGLLNAVKAQHDPRRARVLLIGAGGWDGPSRFHLPKGARRPSRLPNWTTHALMASSAGSPGLFPDCTVTRGPPFAAGHDIIVNATPVGMNPDDGLPGAIGDFTTGMTVVDIVPAPAPTALLRKASAEGAAVIPGSAMTEGQSTALLRFFGIEE
ncbi:hypothetical protein LP421_32945 (plasmid) [Rhizobium sp. RCAM05350]|uniref:shikimate dehydrogenase family protein n=1 Tax=Rhizobium sp. RCAM05350 TaxID=2895568 RepID=UPI002076B592|nr:hypothetical protein [Rhizobium sp. RCAM05350]URK89477.1 hypothetical protein LP421_32945 [Rhizobium sp. RCAM05350]